MHVEFEYMGKTQEIPVTIVESPINSITVNVPNTPIELMENSKEYFYTWTEEGYFFRSKDGLFLPLTDEGEDPIRITTEQYDEHWLLGNTYIAEVEYMGKTAKVPIKIVENDIASIAYSPKTPFSVNKDKYHIEYDEDDQYITHWEVGKTYYITMEYGGKQFKYQSLLRMRAREVLPAAVEAVTSHPPRPTM